MEARLTDKQKELLTSLQSKQVVEGSFRAISEALGFNGKPVSYDLETLRMCKLIKMEELKGSRPFKRLFRIKPL